MSSFNLRKQLYCTVGVPQDLQVLKYCVEGAHIFQMTQGAIGNEVPLSSSFFLNFCTIYFDGI